MDLGEDNISNIGAKTANTVSFVLGGKFGSLILSALLFIFLARILGPSTYGIYTLAIAFAGIFGSVGNFGIATTLNKFVSEYKQKKDDKQIRKVISNGILLAAVVGIVLSAITFALSGVLAVHLFSNASLTPMLQIASLTLFAAILVGSLVGILVGLGKGKQVLISSLVQSLFQIAVTVSLVFLGFGASAPIIGLIVGYLAGSGAALYFIYKNDSITSAFSDLSLKSLKKLLTFSMPVALSSVSVNILPDLSIIALGIYETAAVVGNFGIAVKINTLLYTVVIDAIAFSLLSTFTSTLAGKRSYENIGIVYNYSVYFAFLLLVPGILFLAVMATPLSYTLFGGNYNLAPVYMEIIAVGFVIWIIGAFASNVLVSAGRVWEVLKYNIVIEIAVIILLPFLSGYMDGLGIVADIFLLAPILYDLVFFAKIRNIYKIKLNTGKLLRVVIANLVVILLIYLTNIFVNTNSIVLIGISLLELILIYPLLAALLGAASAHDLKLIESTTKKIPFVRLVAGYFVAYARLVVR